MDTLLNTLITVLVLFLTLAQIILAIRQIKKKAPDGRILLTINVIVLAIWIPLCICKYIYSKAASGSYSALDIIWYAVAVLYMIFAIWYTNMLNKTRQP